MTGVQTCALPISYQFDKNGNVVVGDRTEWSYGRFGRFQGYSGSFSYTFNNDTWKNWFGKEKDKKKEEKNEQENTDREDENRNENEEDKLNGKTKKSVSDS